MSVWWDIRKVRRLADREGLWLKIPAPVARLLNVEKGDRVTWEVRTPSRGADMHMNPNLNPGEEDAT